MESLGGQPIDLKQSIVTVRQTLKPYGRKA